MIKKMDFYNHFYPQKNDIIDMIDNFNQILVKAKWQPLQCFDKKAVIVPHAGYVYSGFTANIAYRSINDTKAKRIIVIGPSHNVQFDSISILDGYSHYDTPFGHLNIDIDYNEILKNKFNFIYDERIHKEHSVEVQMPFIKRYCDKPIIQIVYSSLGFNSLCEVIEFLLQDDDNLLIISTDLSHFHSLQEAKNIDSDCIKSIASLDISKWEKCEACGEIGVRALIKNASKLGLNAHMLDYRTSFDYSNDDSSVVGYLSVLISS